MSERKAKWEDILAGMSVEYKAEYAAFLTVSPEEQYILTFLRGPDIRRISENRHVDDNEFFDVNDYPWRYAKLLLACKEQEELIAEDL